MCAMKIRACTCLSRGRKRIFRFCRDAGQRGFEGGGTKIELLALTRRDLLEGRANLWEGCGDGTQCCEGIMQRCLILEGL